jgi:hypothetical protein
MSAAIASYILRLFATFCFLLGCWVPTPGGWPMLLVGLFLWCLSTLIPPPSGP